VTPAGLGTVTSPPDVVGGQAVPPTGSSDPQSSASANLRDRLRAVRLPQLAQVVRPVFWLVLSLLILVPSACFLILAISPRLFDQGPQWFTLSNLRGAFTGATAVALTNSVWVSCAAAGLGLAVGFPIAWLSNRTTLAGRRFVMGGMWLVLLLPSWLPALGWERLVESDGVMNRVGINAPFITHAILGPFGVVLLLGLRCVPFSYLAVMGGLGGLGQEFEDAARVHGASRFGALRLVAPILLPAIWSALAIGFAESVSDFGVAATLAYNSHFSLATYQLYENIDNFPPDFPAAAAIAWLLVLSVAVPLALQARSLRGRAYAVLSGRTRQVIRRQLSRPAQWAASGGVGLFFLFALGIPAIGAVSGSLLADYGASDHVTLANYQAVLHGAGEWGPIQRSLLYGALTATLTVIGGVMVARLLAKRRTRSTRFLDFLLLASVALPSVVFAAGYIFAYNLPIFSRLGIDIYQTVTLLIIGYIAASLPTNARVLVGSMSQLDPSLLDAARAHGAGPMRAWLKGVLPVISRPIVMAWLLTFGAIFLELPMSQLLYAPGSPPLSVAIQDNLGNYHFGVGMAQAVVAVVIAFAVIGAVLGAYRLLAPAGWRRIGVATRG
jgi:iron(III) transport system permease protein